MDALWAAFIGGLTGSAVAGGLVFLRDYFEAKRHKTSEALAAVATVLVWSMSLVQLADALRLTMRIRSGLSEGLDIALRIRKPLEPLDISDRIHAVLQPLFAAQTTVWAKGSPEMIPLVNEVVYRCFDLAMTATEAGRSGSAVRRYVLGERWSDEQERDYQEAAKLVGEARRRLALRLREEAKSPEVEDLIG